MIADAVYVLSSARLYGLPRGRIRDALAPLVRLPLFRVRGREEVLRALDLYATTHLDFGDALLVAAMERPGVDTLYSYDRHFDPIEGVNRREP